MYLTYSPQVIRNFQHLNAENYREMFVKTMECDSIEIRGQKCKEILNLQLEIHPEYPFMDFTERNLKINYFKKEMIWKLGASAFDESIKDHAKMWAFVQNKDGSFNSNYGQYWFGEQLGLLKAFNELIIDQFSRRAVIPMLRPSHLGPHVNDTVCTGHITFHIRPLNGKLRLHMSVSMRSSDQVFGLGTDIPTFCFLYRLMHGMLQVKYPELYIGKLSITADSSHIYERHFELVTNIINNSCLNDVTIMPLCKTDEAFYLAACGGKLTQKLGDLTVWLGDNK